MNKIFEYQVKSAYGVWSNPRTYEALDEEDALRVEGILTLSDTHRLIKSTEEK